ncbi:hypothetical protein MBLNU459_g6258t2 [Dothideomycetes sp. NU459]
MAKEHDRNAESHAGEEELQLLGQASREGSPDSDIVAQSNQRHMNGPRRQSSFAQPRPNGTPRTVNRVRFDVEDSVHGDGSVADERDEEANGWLEEEDYLSSNGHAEGHGRRDSGQRAPLLTDIEAPSVTVAESDFNPEDLLESARPKSNMRSAFMNMANSIIGAGIIGQPYAIRQAGLLTGIVLLIGLTITVDWTIRLIVTNSKMSGANSFQATMEHCFGKSGLVAISIAQWAFAFGGMVAFCIIVGDTIPHVVTAIFPSWPTSHFLWLLTDRRAVIVVFIMGVSYPLSLYRDIAKLAKASTMALVSMLVIIVTVITQGPRVPPEMRGPIKGSLLINNGVFQAIGVISFAFVCHHNSLLIYGSLKKPTMDRFARVTHFSTSISMLACLAMALSGYLNFGSLTQGNVLNNFPTDNIMVNVARLCFGLNMLTTLPLEAFVCREVMTEYYFPHEPFNPNRHLIFSTSLVFSAMMLSLLTCDLGIVFELNLLHNFHLCYAKIQEFGRINMSDTDAIWAAFGHDSALCDRILAAAKQNRDQMQLFADMARYASKFMTRDLKNDSVPSSKKRKLEESSEDVNQAPAGGQKSVILSAPDTSFSIPQRKKLALEVTSNSQSYTLVARNTASGDEHEISFDSIEQIFCLPVPEKAQRQWNFVVFASPRTNGTEQEQIVWTMNEVAPTNMAFADGWGPQEHDSQITCTIRTLNVCLGAFGKTVITPDESEFASAIPQSHRKGEKAYHVKAHRGSKDGYLFFLTSGILWAFKKPLAQFTFENIESTSYTSVLQRTFNLVITTMPDVTTGKKEETEFSMLDQADFAGIDEYIKKHNLNDASMAEERRAKKLHINGKPKTEENVDGEPANGVEQEDDEETELQKAERQLEDEEDEEEEDYDPGSEGESEGEGSSSGEEDEGGDEAEEMEEDDAEGDDEE